VSLLVDATWLSVSEDVPRSLLLRSSNDLGRSQAKNLLLSEWVVRLVVMRCITICGSSLSVKARTT